MNKENLIELVTSQEISENTKLLWIEKVVGFGSCSMDVGSWLWSNEENDLLEYLFDYDLVNTIADLLIRHGIKNGQRDLYEFNFEEIFDILKKQSLKLNKEKEVIEFEKILNKKDLNRIGEISNILNKLNCRVDMKYFTDINKALELVKEHQSQINIENLNQTFKEDYIA